MRDKTYRFKADIKCHTDAGTECLRDFRVSVCANTESDARRFLKDVAFEVVADAGGDLLDGNLLNVELSNIRAL